MQGLMTTKELSAYLSVSKTYIEDRRANGDWQEGTHWVYLNPNSKRAGVRYIPELCLHWVIHQSCLHKHRAYVAQFRTQHQLSA